MLTVLVVMFLMVAAAAVLAMLVVMLLMMGMLQLLHCLFQGILPCHGLQNLLAGQLGPGSGHQGGMGIVLADQLHGSIQLRLRHCIGAGKDDGFGGFNLIIVELAKVFHIYLNLADIRNRHGAAQHHIFVGHLFHRRDHIAELAHAGGLDHDPVGVILLDHLIQRLAEIAHQAAANAAGVHFRNVNAGILQETAVNTDLTKLIFDQYQLLTAICFLNHFLDQRGLTGAKKSGININCCHNSTFYL